MPRFRDDSILWNLFSQSPPFQGQRQQRKYNRRNNAAGNSGFNRRDIDFSHIRKSGGNHRNSRDIKQHFDKVSDGRARNNSKYNSSIPYLKWLNDEEDPKNVGMKMLSRYWGKISAQDPEENLISACLMYKAPEAVPPWDGVSPRGEQGMATVVCCPYCNFYSEDMEDIKEHLLEKTHYFSYSAFCKNHAKERNMLLEEKDKTEKKRKLAKKKAKESSSETKVKLKATTNAEEKSKSPGKKKDEKKLNKSQDKRVASLAMVNVAPCEALSLEEELNYDFLE